MKFIKLKSTITAAAVLAAFSPVPPAKAADIRLEGTGSYDLSSKVRYYPTGRKQTGRYLNLGADYYHKATVRMEWIINNSRVKSGNLSFEFWGMPYYGADEGVVLMTRGLKPLSAGRVYKRSKLSGWAISLDEYRFPELNIWERTRKGWGFRDALSFTRDNLL